MNAKAVERRKKGQYNDPTIEPALLGIGDEDIEFLKRYRFHRAGVDFISQLLHDDLERKDKRGNPVPVQIQVRIYLLINVKHFFRFW